MTGLFYEIINNIEHLSEKNYKEFSKKLESLIEGFKEHDDSDNLNVLRNKLEVFLDEYKKDKNQSKKIKGYIKHITHISEDIEELVEEIEEKRAKEELIDVVKQVEQRYESCERMTPEKREKCQEVCVKKSTIKYEKEIIKLQLELVKLQRHIIESGQKVLVIFEGRDAAGKGGNIKRFTEYLNPRASRVVALQKPNEVEKTQWYFQRYIQHLPNGGEVVFFDRSWYNRAGVEPVMGFVNKKNYEKFLEDVPVFEKMLIDSGIKIIKLYYSVSKKEQAERFDERRKNPLKQFKLSPIDQFSQKLWSKYTLAEYHNFKNTHTKDCPWVIINSDDKKASRINSMKYLLSLFDYPQKISEKELAYDRKVVYTGEEKVARLAEEIDTDMDLFD